jgi:arylsulfatase A-like enzyme
MTDQQQAAAMSCAGNPDLNTPAMDSLAEKGVRCTKAYTAFPLCVPARSSLFTGQMPSVIGSMFNGPGIPEDRVDTSLGNVFSNAGYTTAYAGKWHAPEIAMQPKYGFERICGFDDQKVADACAEFLARAHDAPFFLVASFDNPHNICEHGRDQNLPWGPVPDAPPEQYPNLPPNFCIAPFEPDAVDICARDMPRIAHRGRLTPERWRKYRHAYFRLVEKVDREIGRILEALDRSGVADNTLVIFTSDHGDHAGAHQIGQKTFLYEEAVRVPFLMRWPGRIEPGTVRHELVSVCLDIYPTLCDVCSVEAPQECPGASLQPLFGHAPADNWRDQVVTQTTLVQCSEPNTAKGRMLRTDRFKYILYDWGEHREQLFDLDADPGEMVNLAVEQRYADVLQDHRDRLHAWMLEHKDSMHSGGRNCPATGVPHSHDL